ncbi:hypothetical protein [Actinoplanes sp. NPDC048796]|uniref:hypothetical protein n=1 Tax=Actinoplanes sp. NPDC048796 TaxID=3155640 RepID=UPI0033DF6DDC
MPRRGRLSQRLSAPAVGRPGRPQLRQRHVHRYSGDLGFPLPANWAFDQITNTVLAAGTAGEVEIDNDIVSGRGLGVNSVTRPRDPNDGFSTMLIWIEARASQWWVDHPGRSGPELVAQWLRMRSNAFAFHGADTVFGELDSGFIDVVRGYPGRPDGCQWYQSGLSSDEAYAFAADRFATRADNSFLSLGDYFADVDAWVIGQQSRLDPAIPLSALFRRQYATRDTAANRFGGFFARRFGLNADRARVCAANMFDQPGDAKTAGIRNAFWWDQFGDVLAPTPVLVSGTARAGVARAFADLVVEFASAP